MNDDDFGKISWDRFFSLFSENKKTFAAIFVMFLVILLSMWLKGNI